jgi:beta-lactamase regulating signal transducer with metallopeptidase domain
MGTLLEIVLSNAVVAALLALAAAALSALCRRPALAHRLWLLVLLKLVTPPLLPVHLPPAAHGVLAGLLNRPGHADASRADSAPTQEVNPAGPEALTPAVAAEGPPPTAPPEAEAVTPLPGEPASPAPCLAWLSASGPALLVPLWLATALVWLGWNAVQMARFGRLLRHTLPAPTDLQGEADGLARRLGLRRAPAVRLVPGAVPPMVWGVGPAQRLLFPARLLGRLDAGQRASLLLHELAHVRRGDPWVRVLELVVLPLYWWHPVAWWARRELHEAEEQCCDAWVVWALEGSGRTYALALLQAVALCANVRCPLPLAASGIGQVPHLRRRLTMIMQGKTPRSLSRAGVVTVLGLGLLLLPLLRVSGQVLPPAPEPAANKDAADRLVQDLENAVRALKEQQQADQQRRSASDAKAAPPSPTPAAQPDPGIVQQALSQYRRALRAEAAGADDLKKAEAEAEAVGMEVRAKERELEEARARFAAAVDRLKRLQAEHSARIAPQAAKSPPPPAGMPGPDRLNELERKLERVLDEVQDLRKELHRQQGPVPPPAVPPPPAPILPRVPPPPATTPPPAER